MKELEIGAVLFLLWNSIYDLWKKEIVPVSIVVFAGLRILYFVLHISDIASAFWGIIPGILLLGIGKISRGAIGQGDGIVIMMTGFYVGLQMTVTMIMWAFLLASLWSILFLVLRRYKSQSRIPFVPFLLLGLVLTLVI